MAHRVSIGCSLEMHTPDLSSVLRDDLIVLETQRVMLLVFRDTAALYSQGHDFHRGRTMSFRDALGVSLCSLLCPKNRAPIVVTSALFCNILHGNYLYISSDASTESTILISILRSQSTAKTATIQLS